MKHRESLSVDLLEDRCVPSGTRVPAGEFDWMEVSPDGEIAQLIWSGSQLVYRTRASSGWSEEVIDLPGFFGPEEFNDRDVVARATRSAKLLFEPDGTPNAFHLAFGSLDHYRRGAEGWGLVESLSPPAGSDFPMFNHLAGDVGSDGSFHLVFTESIGFDFEGSGSGALRYATNEGGSWTFEKVADTGDLSNPVKFFGQRYLPRFLSIDVDSQNFAHISYTPEFRITDAGGGLSTAFSALAYATNRTPGGNFATEIVFSPPDGTGDAGLAASLAVGPGDTIAIANHFVDRADTGSPASARLLYHQRQVGGGWATSTVVSTPDGYVASDGPNFTGFQPELEFIGGQPVIAFSDVAAAHLPETIANEMAGQIRLATLGGGGWSLQTVFPQSNPLVNEVYYPTFEEFNGQLVFAGLRGENQLDGNGNVTSTAFSLFDLNAPTVPVPPPGTPDGEPGAGIVAPDQGGGPEVKIFNQDGTLRVSFLAYEGEFTGGVRVASGDVNNDGTDDVLTGPGPGRSTELRIYSGIDGSSLGSVQAFEPSFTLGVFVASADLNGDGFAEIVVSPDQGGGPRVRVLDGQTQEVLADFFGIEDPNFRGGARVALGDINGDGIPDLLVAAGFGGGPRVAAFDGTTLRPGMEPVKLFPDFFVFEQALRNGAFVAAGDINGDNSADLIAGGGPGGGPRVFILSGRALVDSNGTDFQQLGNFFAGDVSSRGGVRVAVTNLDNDARPDLLAGAGEGAGSRVTAYQAVDIPSDGVPPTVRNFEAFPGFGGGVFVG